MRRWALLLAGLSLAFAPAPFAKAPRARKAPPTPMEGRWKQVGDARMLGVVGAVLAVLDKRRFRVAYREPSPRRTTLTVRKRISRSSSSELFLT